MISSISVDPKCNFMGQKLSEHNVVTTAVPRLDGNLIELKLSVENKLQFK